MNLQGGSYAGVELRPARFRLGLDGTVLEVEGVLQEGVAQGRVRADLAAPHAYEVDVGLSEADPARWLALAPEAGERFEGWGGHLEGRVDLRGALDDPTALAGSISLARAEAVRGSLELQLKAPAALRFEGGEALLEGLTITGPGTHLRAQGRRSVEGRLELRLDGRGDLQVLETLLPGVQSARGAVEVDAAVTGTFERPVLVGAATLRDGSLRARGAPLSLERLGGELSFSQNAVVFDRLSAVAGGGRVELGGAMWLRHFLPARLSLHSELDQVRVEVPEGLHSRVSGGLSLEGEVDALRLGGELNVEQARYTAPLEVDEALAAFRARALAPPTGPRAPWVRLDVGLHADDTVVVDNGAVKGLFRADLRLVGTDQRPGLLGSLTAVDGTATFRGNLFRIERATAIFNDPNRVVPEFDVHATSDIRDYRVRVHAFGTPAKPELDLSSDPELADTDLLTLITLGITSRDAQGIDQRGSGLAGLDALFAISGLDRRVRAFMPDDPLVPEMRLTTGFSRVTGQVEPRLALEWRLIEDRLRLRHSQPIGVDGQKTQAEYRITDTISAQAEWDTEDSETSFGNLGVDLKLRWELE